MTKEKNEYYNLLPVGIKKSKALTLNQKNVLAVLIYLEYTYSIEAEQNDGWFYQNLKGLVEITNLSKPTILSSLLVLSQKGFISIETGSLKEAKANQYKINHFLLHKYNGKSVKTSVKNDDDNFTDRDNIDNIENQLVNVVENTRKSVKNDNDNFTDNSDKTSVKKDYDNFTTVTVTDTVKEIYNNNNNNIYNDKIYNNFENPLKEDFQNINNTKAIMDEIEKLNQRLDKSAIFIKEIIDKLENLEKENIDLKNEISSIKRSNNYLEKRVNDIEDIVLPSEEEYENNADTNEEFSFTSPKPANMTDEEWQKKWNEEIKKW